MMLDLFVMLFHEWHGGFAVVLIGTGMFCWSVKNDEAMPFRLSLFLVSFGAWLIATAGLCDILVLGNEGRSVIPYIILGCVNVHLTAYVVSYAIFDHHWDLEQKQGKE